MDDDCKVADITVENNGDGTGIVTVVPTGEGRETINLIATNPTTKKQLPIRTVNLDFKYDQITVVPSVISKDGSFSRYDANSGILIIGDGESLNLGFGVQEKGVDIEDIKVEIQSQDNSRLVSVLPTSNTSQNGQLSVLYTLKHSKDTKDYNYRIIEGYRPVRDIYSEVYDPDSGTSSLVKNRTEDYLATDFQWKFRQSTSRPNAFADLEYDDYYELIHTPTGARYCYYYDETDDVLQTKWSWQSEESYGFRRVRDTSLDGKIMSVSEFEGIAWYYCPGGDYGEGNHVVVSAKIMTTNINAIKELSTNTSIKSTKQTDILRITVKRTIEGQGTVDKVFQIPIYTETRGCAYNQK